MAGASLLTLLDDITALLDDVSVMSKVAAKKTAGVLGDDLALNAQQVTGVSAARELPVVWSVAKGSLLNKVILVPAALAISAFASWLITPLLMLGGLFLCFEGAEKILGRWLHPQHDTKAPPTTEAEKIKGAIRTDFILSAEIIVLTLGVVAAEPFLTQVLTMSAIAIAMTIGVYGLVAVIVKIDDVGLYFSQKANALKHLGKALLAFAPWLMKTLSVVGTAAMFLVGGGILTHGVHSIGHWIEHASLESVAIPGIGKIVSTLLPTLLNGAVGLLAGAVLVLLITAFHKWRQG
uniref:DUF808 domain-containing protein n=1 Tax=Thaumasiovibrio occultus TaxID=1891184 RepID=UPI000B36083D|nr:DUF808 domain-containing protein [Thaumasiovibrio occultus]